MCFEILICLYLPNEILLQTQDYKYSNNIDGKKTKEE